MPGRPKGVANKKKKIKDVNKPKRAATAYFCYLGHCRQLEKDAGRKVSKVAVFTKEVSDKWRKLTDHDKGLFNEQAATDRTRYEKEMKVYKGTCGHGGKDPDKPKRAMSSYFFFLPVFRKSDEAQSLSHTDKVKMAGAKWRAMNSAEKAPYEHMAREDQARYEAQNQAWRKKNSAETAKAQSQQNNSANDDDDEEDEEEDEEDDEEEDDEEDE